MVSLDEVAGMSLALPGVTEGERYGDRTWLVAGKAFAWDRPLRKSDRWRYGDETPPSGPIVAVRVEDLGEKEAVLAEGRRGFFTIPHFDGYPAVLVQLSAVGEAGDARRHPRRLAGLRPGAARRRAPVRAAAHALITSSPQGLPDPGPGRILVP